MSYLKILRQLIPYAKPYRRLVTTSVILTILTAGLAQVTPLAARFLVDKVSILVERHAGFEESLQVVLFAILLLFLKELLSLLTNFGVLFLGERLKVLIRADLSNQIFDHLLTLDMLFFDKESNEPGRLSKRIDRGIEGLSKTIKNLFVDILPLFFTAGLALVVMYSFSFIIGLISTLIVPIYFLLSFRQAQKQKGVRHIIQDIHEDRTSLMFSVLSSIKLVKSFNRESFEIDRHKAITDDLAEKEIRHHLINHSFDSLKLFFDQIGALLVIVVTSILVLRGEMSIGAIMLHLLLYNNITLPIRHLHRIYDETNEAIAYAAGFFDVLYTKSHLNYGHVSSDNKSTMEGALKIENVSFSYVDDQEVIHDVSLTVPPKKVVALVGLSGAGKTTLANLIGRFYDPQSGYITLDGVNLQDYTLDSLRQHIGFVLQQSYIFPGSIEDNIRYGRLNASHVEVIEAAKMAGLHEDILKLARGYKSVANRLSGGQMQRIAIARLFLKNPSVLILDEPTASLDAISAEHIQSALKSIQKQRSVLIISHNLASIIDADKIYVVKEGCIIGAGDHNSLYETNSHYREIIDTNIRIMNLEKLLSVQ